MGVNAAVVGLLLAAPEDFALAAGAFALLAFWNAPPLLVVALAAGAGALITLY